MEFDLPKDTSAVIKVIGVGGGGSNAVNHMYNQGIVGVDFIVCNTDRQSLDISPVPIKIQLGTASTQGRGAGSIPQVGMEAANENIEDIRDLLSHDTNMVFITAGLGGGTGTGAAPVIAQIAKDLGILKYSIPEFILNNKDLMKMIKELSEASTEDGGSGAFYIYLKNIIYSSNS